MHFILQDLFIFKILHQYSIDYCSTVEGTSEAGPAIYEKLGCSALICKAMHEDFCKKLPEFKKAQYSKKEILLGIKNVEVIFSFLNFLNYFFVLIHRDYAPAYLYRTRFSKTL